MQTNPKTICIVGLGYVGHPLSIAFSLHYPIIGFDINEEKINQLNASLAKEKQSQSSNILFTSNQGEIGGASVFIITVPTPVNHEKKIDLSYLEHACKIVAHVLKKGDVVIIESTVYPGITEGFCVPVLEKNSQLVYNTDFFVGYSPERINPGDTIHTLTNITKVISGSTPDITTFIDELYKKIITAGTYKAPSIKIAEAAKVVENAQRDLNIAFMNELSIILNKGGLSSKEVLNAASTKWNFLSFQPGLVGGYCVSAAPLYLAQYAQNNNYNPELILTGRKLNDYMSHHITNEMLQLMQSKNIEVNNAEILILGFTFKENCSEIRNSKVAEIADILQEKNARISIYDPHADAALTYQLYGVSLLENIPDKKYDAVLLAVAHNEFKTIDFQNLLHSNSVLFDTKNLITDIPVDGRL